MKQLLFIAFILFQTAIHAQKPCEFSTSFTDSLGSYKETKAKIMHERNFSGSSNHIYFSLANIDDTPVLNFQSVQKSKDFMKAKCFDKNSKIYLQLINGTIITLLISEDGNCGSTIRDEAKNTNIRITSASFLFMKNSIEQLKKHPISLIRIKYASEMVDYVVKSNLISELDNEIYFPETFFIDYLPCIDN